LLVLLEPLWEIERWTDHVAIAAGAGALLRYGRDIFAMAFSYDSVPAILII
jgi:hypothetical protein